MSLPGVHKLRDEIIYSYSPSIGASPATAYARAPFRGFVSKLGVIVQGAITTADATVATTVNGTAIAGGSIDVVQSGAAAGQVFEAVPTVLIAVNEGDYVSFAPSGAGGTAIGAMFYAVIREG